MRLFQTQVADLIKLQRAVPLTKLLINLDWRFGIIAGCGRAKLCYLYQLVPFNQLRNLQVAFQLNVATGTVKLWPPSTRRTKWPVNKLFSISSVIFICSRWAVIRPSHDTITETFGCRDFKWTDSENKRIMRGRIAG